MATEVYDEDDEEPRPFDEGQVSVLRQIVHEEVSSVVGRHFWFGAVALGLIYFLLR